MLGIAELGEEAFASLYALYGQSRQLGKLAAEWDISPGADSVSFYPELLKSHRAIEPKVSPLYIR